MNSFKNRICKIHIMIKKQNLFYTATIIDITNTHITFIDKFNTKYSYNMNNIIEIKET